MVVMVTSTGLIRVRARPAKVPTAIAGLLVRLMLILAQHLQSLSLSISIGGLSWVAIRAADNLDL